MRWSKVAMVGALVGGTILTGSASGDVGPGVRAPHRAAKAWARVRARHGMRPLRLAPPAPLHAPSFDPFLLTAPPPPPKLASWIRVGGLKSKGPKLNRSEAGITVALGKGLAFQLHYERTAQAPMMRRDHDDGFLTRLRLTF